MVFLFVQVEVGKNVACSFHVWIDRYARRHMYMLAIWTFPRLCNYDFVRSTFAVDGSNCTVNKEVERVLKDFHKSGKPIG